MPFQKLNTQIKISFTIIYSKKKSIFAVQF